MWYNFLIGGYLLATCLYELTKGRWIMASIDGLIGVGNLIVGGLNL